MTYRLKNGDMETDCHKRNLDYYLANGWEIVDNTVPQEPIVEVYGKLTKVQLQDLCKEKGVKFTPRDNKTILKEKLNVVNSKTIKEKPSNKGFNDSLIKTK